MKEDFESMLICGKTWFNSKKERIMLQESRDENGMSYGIWKREFLMLLDRYGLLSYVSLAPGADLQEPVLDNRIQARLEAWRKDQMAPLDPDNKNI